LVGVEIYSSAKFLQVKKVPTTISHPQFVPKLCPSRSKIFKENQTKPKVQKKVPTFQNVKIVEKS